MRGRMALLASVVCSACSMFGGGSQPEAAAVPEPATTPAPAPAFAPQPSVPWSPADPPPAQMAAAAPVRTPGLYTRLGGLSAIRGVVDTMLGRVAADTRINEFFRGVNMDTLRLHLVEQICEETGGPCTYRGRPMPTAHRGMGLTNAHFDALVEDLTASLIVHRVPPRERTELLTAMGRMRGQIVGQ